MTATTTQLSLYNKALRHLGERKLASLTEDREARRYLDDEYPDALLVCLRSGLWNFATRSIYLTPSAEAAFGYANAFEKPCDWVRTSWVSASESFDPPLRDYADQENYWLANPEAIYVRYISKDLGGDLAKWPADYAEYVGIVLAKTIAPRLTQNEDLLAGLEKREKEYFERAIVLDNKDQPNLSWPALYDKALRHLGERFLVAQTPSETLEIRRYLDTEYDKTILLCLRAGLWNFATVAVKLDPDSTDPDFGYQSRFEKPADWIRTSMVSTSETFDPPLRNYQDQAGFWYANTDTLYVRYVSSTLGVDETVWPPDFYEYASLALARMIAPRILEPAQVAALEVKEKLYWKRAIANDAMDQPPTPWPLGTWTTSRIRRGYTGYYSNSIKNW